MRQNVLCVLIFAAGCVPDVNVSCPDPDVTVIVESPDGDTDVEDSDEPVDTDVVDTDTDTAEPVNCQFTVESADGAEEFISNEIVVDLSSASPSGAAVPGYGELIRANITSAHQECGSVIITGLNLKANATDSAQSGWVSFFEGRGLEVKDPLLDPSVPVMYAAHVGGGEFRALGAVTVPAGGSVTLKVYGDTTGASGAWDDAIRVDLEGLEVLSEDGTFATRAIHNLPLNGGTLVY